MDMITDMTNQFKNSQDYYISQPRSIANTISSSTPYETRRLQGTETKYLSNIMYTPLHKFQHKSSIKKK